MGRFAEALGVGVHGSMYIALTRAEYVAGDVLAGSVRLFVTTRIERAKPIRLELLGKETLEWDEIHEEKVPVIVKHHEERCENHHDNKKHGARAHKKEKINHRSKCGSDDEKETEMRVVERTVSEKEVFIIIKDQICLDVPARAYEPGKYEFSFEYQLPVRTLVPTFSFQCARLGHMRDVRAKAEYELTARVPINGMFNADLSHVIHPIIREDPSLQVPRQIFQSTTIPVYFCVFFKKGSCELMAALEKDVVPLGGQALLQLFIHNNSTRDVDAVCTKLRQTVVMNQFRASHGETRAPHHTRDIAWGQYAGVKAGEKADITAYQHIQYDKKTRHELLPTMRSHFLAFSYELAVKCKQSWCWDDANATFPLVVTTKMV